MIDAFPAMDAGVLEELAALLEAYAESLTPWARRTAAKMLHEVNVADLGAWRALGERIGAQLRKDIMGAPIGDVFHRLMEEQVALIRSLPIEAAQRVHDMTIKGLEDSTRYAEYAKAIEESGEVTRSRAILIARTETSRTASSLMESRALYVGSPGYTWETADDADVRPSHKEMQGKFVAWDKPPTLDKMTGHAGCFPNCRCWSRVVLPS